MPVRVGVGVMLLLSARAERVCAEIDEQLNLVRALELKFLEFAGAWGKAVGELPDDELDIVARRLEQTCCRVSAVALPAGVSPETFERGARAAVRLGTRYVRIFAAAPESAAPAAAREAVLGVLDAQLAVCERHDLILGLENRNGTYAATAEHVLDLVATLDAPRLRVVFNPGEYVRAGQAPFDHAWPLLRDHVLWLRAQDVSGRRAVPLGEGDGQWLDLLQDAARRNVCGFAVVEPRPRPARPKKPPAHYLRGAVQDFRRLVNAAGDTRGPLRVGLVGLGSAARAHARALAQIDEVVIVAGCDPREAARTQAPCAFGAALYSDVRSLLARAKPDAVCVCAPTGLHAQVTLPALRAGTHALVECPLETTLPRADRMIETAAGARACLACAAPARLAPETLALKAALEDRCCGRPLVAVALLYQGCDPAPRDPADWRGSWELDGGGCLMRRGIEAIDRLLFVLGPVEEVTAITERLHADAEVEDTALALLRFAGGTLGVLVASCNREPAGAEALEIRCEHGRLALRSGPSAPADRPAPAPAGGPRQTETLDCFSPVREWERERRGGELYRAARDFTAAVREGRPPAVSGEAARAAVEVALAIYESGATGRPVRLPLRARVRPLHIPPGGPVLPEEDSPPADPAETDEQAST